MLNIKNINFENQTCVIELTTKDINVSNWFNCEKEVSISKIIDTIETMVMEMRCAVNFLCGIRECNTINNDLIPVDHITMFCSKDTFDIIIKQITIYPQLIRKYAFDITYRCKNLMDIRFAVITNDGEEPLHLRGTGRTTRLIDRYIQELFTEGYIIVKDHYNSLDADRFLTERILKRLKSEHPYVRVNKVTNGNNIILKLTSNG